MGHISCLVYDDDVNLLEITQAPSRETQKLYLMLVQVDPEVNARKGKYMLLVCHQNMVQKDPLKIRHTLNIWEQQ
jgi:hypothetical protein